MVFSSFTFVFGFLPIFLIVYYLTPRVAKNTVVLIASYLFYAWGAPKIVPLLLLSSTADYFISKRLSSTYARRRKTWITLGVSFNVGLLLYYKYSNFFIAETNSLLVELGASPIHWTAVALPIGISFFTFQKISYLVDVYRQSVGPARTIINYLLYVVSFPQLIAGPIVRYRDVNRQIERRSHNLQTILEGFYRFCIGLGKKNPHSGYHGGSSSQCLRDD